jgi:pyridoxamine 5'-phosphate oxidase
MDERDLDPDPITQFTIWLSEARKACPLPNAMTLATADADGHPSARIVLLRGHGPSGFDFYTNRDSRKGREVRANPRAALVFHWWELGRQIRIEGAVEEVSASASVDYWSTRPRESRIAAWASPQSSAIANRAVLDELYAEAESRHGADEIPLPPFWGGFRVVPETIEFWLHRDNRLHDRVRYTRSGEAWRHERLAP